jgi:predicted glycoside hydrolase/deacetylase ChbG (UPF0249 family)
VSPLLVVNADDAGLDPARDAAILDAFDRGIVRSASVVVNGPTAEAFVAAARSRPGFGLGLHLNLTDGRPVATTRPFTLLGADGAFPGDVAEVSRRAVDGRRTAQEVEREVVAQWRRLQGFGITPDHLDGHEHVHVLPTIVDGVLAALRFVGARVHVRVPSEGDPPAGVPAIDTPSLAVGTTIFPRPRMAQVRAGHGGLATVGLHADRVRGAIRPPLRAADGFVGMAFAFAPRLDVLLAGLRAVTGAVVEWMVHPGRMTTRTTAGSSDARREQELALLLLPATRAAVEADGWRLGSFAEASAR